MLLVGGGGGKKMKENIFIEMELVVICIYAPLWHYLVIVNVT